MCSRSITSGSFILQVLTHPSEEAENSNSFPGETARPLTLTCKSYVCVIVIVIIMFVHVCVRARENASGVREEPKNNL